MALPGGRMGAQRPIDDVTDDIKKLAEEQDTTVNEQSGEGKDEKKDEKKDEN